jgi:hypothetical protein
MYVYILTTKLEKVDERLLGKRTPCRPMNSSEMYKLPQGSIQFRRIGEVTDHESGCGISAIATTWSQSEGLLFGIAPVANFRSAYY